MKSNAAILLLSAVLGRLKTVQAAINIDGTQATEPASDNDPSPIGDIEAYDADYNDCPLACDDYANIHSWIPYLSVHRLQRCKSPMLLQFSITQSLDDHKSDVLIRTCLLPSPSNSLFGPSTLSSTAVPVDNPKKRKHLVKPSLESAVACSTTGRQGKSSLTLSTNSGTAGTGDGGQAASLLHLMQDYFNAKDNCDESFIFGYHQKTVAGIYIGAGIGKPTVQSSLQAFSRRLMSDSAVANHTAVELCDNDRKAGRVLGIVVDTTGDLAAVQRTASRWGQGFCASTDGHMKITNSISNVKVWEITATNITSGGNETISVASQLLKRIVGGNQGANTFNSRATYRHEKVGYGDICDVLIPRCRISSVDFYKYNPKKDLCTTLMPGDYVCCSPGEPYMEPKPEPPKPEADGTCATHYIGNGDTCDKIARETGVTIEDIEKWNKGKTWAWSGCSNLLLGYNMCLSAGSPPMPPPQEGTQCGPLVPGTKRCFSFARRFKSLSIEGLLQ